MEEWLRYAVDLRKQGKSHKEIAEEVHLCYGVGHSPTDIFNSLKAKVNRELAKQGIETDDDSEDFKYSEEIKEDGTRIRKSVLSIAHGQDMTPEYCLRAHGFDAGLWKIVNIVNNFWQSQKKGFALLF